jgi:hypothetical protein
MAPSPWLFLQIQHLYTCTTPELHAAAAAVAAVSCSARQVVCQHGQLECDLNKLLSCASAQHPMQDDFFPFLVCMEEAVMSGEKVDVHQLAHKCAVHAGMVTDKLMACYDGE